MNKKRNQSNSQQQRARKEQRNQTLRETESYLKNNTISDKYRDLKSRLKVRPMRNKKDKIRLLKV